MESAAMRAGVRKWQMIAGLTGGGRIAKQHV
jgi:hypothetical protein